MTVMPSRLSLTLFGPFSATVNDRAVPLPTDKTRALLAYLALAPDTPLRREALAGRLWPDQPEALARQNLRKTAGRLKAALDEHDPALAEALLDLTKQTIELRSAALEADALTFGRHIATAQKHGHASLAQCESCLAALETATALYRQGELLAGLSLPDAGPFEEWLVVQRESLHQQQLAALQRLSSAHEQRGAWEAAERYAQWQIQAEPWREEAHRQLMRLLAAQGRRAEALAQYQACRRVLQAELAVEPAAETEALLTQIMEGGVPIVPMQAEAAPAAPWPRPAGPLIGREAEQARIVRLLEEPACRVLTLTGLGGMGKTSLALAVGEALRQAAPAWLPNGVYFVPLAEVTTPNGVAAAVAEALGLTLNQRYSLAAQVEQYLRSKTLLLILDNVEPAAAEADWLRGLTTTAARLKLLATAREPLQWQGEWRYPLEGLAHPAEDAAEREASEAARLFVQAARQVQPGFEYTAANAPAIARICRLVHGWPLALQMAGSWVRLMTPPAIAEQISTSLDLLTTALRGVPAQQQSIRLIFEHTWEALSPSERRSLAGLAVFHGGFTLAAAGAVAAAAPLELAGLVDKALVRHDEGRERYTLHDLLAQFALEKAQADPDRHHATRQAHHRYYLDRLQALGQELGTRRSLEAQTALKADLENVRQAWLGAAAEQQHPWLADRLEALALFYSMSGLAQEGAALLRQTLAVLEAGGAPRPTALMAYTQRHLAESLLFMARYDEATQAVAQARPQAQALNDEELTIQLFIIQAHIYREQGLYEQALAVLQEETDFSRARNNLSGVARAVHIEGNTYWSMARYSEAQACYETARELYAAVGQPAMAAVMVGNLGVVAWRRADYPAALGYYTTALESARQLGNVPRIASWQGAIGLVQVDLGEDEQALANLDEALALHEQVGRHFYRIELLLAKSTLRLRQGDLAGAAEQLRQATAVAYQIGNRTYLRDCDRWQARLYRAQGRPAEAAQLLQSLLPREFRPDVRAQMEQELAALGGAAAK